jgi:hypothetical protein
VDCLGVLSGISSALACRRGLDLGVLALSRGGIVPSAAGGWSVPNVGSGGTLAQLHTDEMVLPADLSKGIQSAFSGGGSGASSSTVHNWNISAVDGASVSKFFKSNGPALVAAINQATRQGSFLRSS